MSNRKIPCWWLITVEGANISAPLEIDVIRVYTLGFLYHNMGPVVWLVSRPGSLGTPTASSVGEKWVSQPWYISCWSLMFVHFPVTIAISGVCPIFKHTIRCSSEARWLLHRSAVALSLLIPGLSIVPNADFTDHSLILPSLEKIQTKGCFC